VGQVALRGHQAVVRFGLDGRGLTADAAPEVVSGLNGRFAGVAARADEANAPGEDVRVGGFDPGELCPSHGMTADETTSGQDCLGGGHNPGLHAPDINNRGFGQKRRSDRMHQVVHAPHRCGEQHQGRPDDRLFWARGGRV